MKKIIILLASIAITSVVAAQVVLQPTQNFEQSITVKAKPVLLVDWDATTYVCQNDYLYIDVIADAAATSITLNYTVDGIAAPTLGLPNTFATASAYATTAYTDGTDGIKCGQIKYTFGIQAGSVGTFVFAFTSLSDGTSCTGTYAGGSKTVVVRQAPTFAGLDTWPTTICKNATLSFTITGIAPFEIDMTVNGTQNDLTLGTTAGTTGGFNYTVSASAPNTTTGQTTYTYTITAGAPGVYAFVFEELRDATASTLVCGTVDLSGNDKTITVLPLPTIAFTDATVCEGDAVTVTFTSGVASPNFMAIYAVKNTACGTAGWITPEDIGFSNADGYEHTFGTVPVTLASPLRYNGSTTITAGQAGVFNYSLYSITDGACTNVRTDYVDQAAWETALP